MPVFCPGTQHRRPADIDLFDGVLQTHVRLRDRRLEGVEIHAEKIDRRDSLLPHVFFVFGIVAAGQQSAVDLRMQGFQAPLEHLRETRVVSDFNHRQPRFAQQARRTAGGQQFDMMMRKSLRKRDHAFFIGNADESSPDAAHMTSCLSNSPRG